MKLNSYITKVINRETLTLQQHKPHRRNNITWKRDILISNSISKMKIRQMRNQENRVISVQLVSGYRIKEQ